MSKTTSKAPPVLMEDGAGRVHLMMPVGDGRTLCGMVPEGVCETPPWREPSPEDIETRLSPTTRKFLSCDGCTDIVNEAFKYAKFIKV